MLRINKKKNDINSAPFISLCLDENTDITKSARLAVFARYCVENIIKEELIAITSLLTTTKGTDNCTAVRNSLAEKEIDLKKIVSVTTDGAPNMKKWHIDPKRFATSALYRSPLTVTLWPSSFLKKYGPMIPPAHKAHQTVSFSGCNGVSTYTCGLASLQMRQFCFLT
ncbi:general transcription factor II-I repeat domain-containing protein 2A [Trichonephila clavipes]|nr:general transcription factor II-I repeat domain-containing protein 2A [Trichonephila clavipes]